MAGKALTRDDLARALTAEVGLSRTDSAALVDRVLEHISDALVRGEAVKVTGFGTFSLRDKAARVGRNPRTGEEAPITPRRVLSFRPSAEMKARVDQGHRDKGG
ncbi:integration host factor subunit alpha [Rubellimicrobium aerolatum]|uniref:Integration host factor subunit alpha n=1 Tax=Rubellimicrobium aerolatum TaxID=490979 RepID=A0ABW0SEL7_9RHOB